MQLNIIYMEIQACLGVTFRVEDGSLSLTLGAPAKSSSPRRRTRTLPASRTSMISSKQCLSLNSHARSVRAYAVERGGDPRNLSRSQRAEAASEGAPHSTVLLQPGNTRPLRGSSLSNDSLIVYAKLLAVDAEHIARGIRSATAATTEQSGRVR